MTRNQRSSSSLFVSLLAACLAGVFGCSSEAEVPEGVVIQPWSIAFGGVLTETRLTGITTDSSGNVAVAGNFSGATALGGSIDLGGGPLDTTAESNFFLAKLDSTGKHVWSGSAGGGDDFAEAIGLDSDGSTVAAGTFHGFIDFGSGGEVNGNED